MARPNNGFGARLLSVVNDPLNYLLSVGLFAYRGMWFMQPSGLAAQLDPLTFCALSAVSLLCLLGVFFSGLIAGDRILVAAFGLAAVAFFVHAALSHGLPRYNAPITPLVVVAVFWICVAFGRYANRGKQQTHEFRRMSLLPPGLIGPRVSPGIMRVYPRKSSAGKAVV